MEELKGLGEFLRLLSTAGFSGALIAFLWFWNKGKIRHEREVIAADEDRKRSVHAAELERDEWKRIALQAASIARFVTADATESKTAIVETKR